jgi:hypothetical protein
MPRTHYTRRSHQICAFYAIKRPHAVTMSGLGGKPMEYALFEHFRCGDGRALCTQAGHLHQVLPAENWKEPKGVRDHRERVLAMLG